MLIHFLQSRCANKSVQLITYNYDRTNNTSKHTIHYIYPKGNKRLQKKWFVKKNSYWLHMKKIVPHFLLNWSKVLFLVSDYQTWLSLQANLQSFGTFGTAENQWLKLLSELIFFILDSMFNFFSQDLFLILTSCLMRKYWLAKAGLLKSRCVPWLTVLWLIWFTMCAHTFLFHICH